MSTNPVWTSEDGIVGDVFSVIGQDGQPKQVLLGPGSGSSSPSALNALGTYIDPQNASGHASDANPGTNALPILTQAELNRRAVGSAPAQFTEIVWLSSETLTDVPVDLSGLTSWPGPYGGTSAQTLVELLGQPIAPVVLHSGVLTAGTRPMNPLLSQIAIAEDTLLASWDPYLTTPVGGTLIIPALITDTATGGSAWVVSGEHLPATQVGLAAPGGNLVAGDPYEVVVLVVTSILALPAPNEVQLVEAVALGFALLPPITTPGFFADQCAFAGTLIFAGGFGMELINCAVAYDLQTSGYVLLEGGFWFNGDGAGFNATPPTGTLGLDSNVWVEQRNGGGGPYGLVGIVVGDCNAAGNPGWLNVQVGENGAFVANATQGVLVGPGGTLSINGLLWSALGTLTGYGMVLLEDASVSLQGIYSSPASVPTITGTLGDFAFVDHTNALQAAFLPFVTATGTYTAPPAAATWAAAFGVGTAQNAQWPETGSKIVSVGLPN